jgi:hypothetical protein
MHMLVLGLSINSTKIQVHAIILKSVVAQKKKKLLMRDFVYLEAKR